MGLAISLTPTILSLIGWNQNYQVWQSSNVCHSFLSSQAPKYLLRKCEDLVRNVFRHLSHSPKRMHQFKKLRVFCAFKPNKARWLFQRAAVERLLVAASSILFFNRSSEDNLHTTKYIPETQWFNVETTSYVLTIFFQTLILSISFSTRTQNSSSL